MGRWLNRDPIGERGGLNLYAFVGNDGVNLWDLLGLWTRTDSIQLSTLEKARDGDFDSLARVNYREYKADKGDSLTSLVNLLKEVNLNVSESNSALWLQGHRKDVGS